MRALRSLATLAALVVALVALIAVCNLASGTEWAGRVGVVLFVVGCVALPCIESSNSNAPARGPVQGRANRGEEEVTLHEQH